ncbi:MAG: XdhC family protein [Nostocaceae cyanobacterium]|nr:XdhC family protein [Nostocaceae cyanobacterium]
MNETQAIIATYTQHPSKITYLATVVNTKGSTYRRPGAKMLITSTGEIIGMVSGGCLENDVYEHTCQRMPDGKPILVTYDTTADEDILWGFGLGCNGIVQVLIERLDEKDPCNPLNFLSQCLDKKQQGAFCPADSSGAIATIFAVEGNIKANIGCRLILHDDGSIITNITDSNLTQSIIADTQVTLRNKKSSINKYQLSSGTVEVFIEIIQPPTALIIFGAGADAIPVAQFAKTLGWHVTIVDCRANQATFSRFPMADEVILTRREIIPKQVTVDDQTVAVVMTHNYLDDLEIVKMLLPSTAKYIGCLGPKKRTEKLLIDLYEQGLNYTNNQIEKLHFPIGIDIGAETPEAIAIAIIAEIQAVLTKRDGGMLKHHQGAIHQPLNRKETKIKPYQQ